MTVTAPCTPTTAWVLLEAYEKEPEMHLKGIPNLNVLGAEIYFLGTRSYSYSIFFKILLKTWLYLIMNNRRSRTTILHRWKNIQFIFLMDVKTICWNLGPRSLKKPMTILVPKGRLLNSLDDPVLAQ